MQAWGNDQPLLPGDVWRSGAADLVEQFQVRAGREVEPRSHPQAWQIDGHARLEQTALVPRGIGGSPLDKRRSAGARQAIGEDTSGRSEEHTSELQSLMRTSYT